MSFPRFQIVLVQSMLANMTTDYGHIISSFVSSTASLTDTLTAFTAPITTAFSIEGVPASELPFNIAKAAVQQAARHAFVNEPEKLIALLSGI
jgi:hypothetical protein